MQLNDGSSLDHIIFLTTKHWQFVLATLGAAAGVVMWSWNQYMARFCNRRELEAYIHVHSREHEEIKGMIHAVRNDMHDKQAELLYTILELKNNRD